MHRWSRILYLLGVLVILIPIIIVLSFDVYFSSFISRLIVGFSTTLFIAGRTLIVIQKKKENRTISWDIGILLGASIILVLELFS